MVYLVKKGRVRSMYMLTHISMTPGTLLFLAGVILLIAAVMLAVITAATAGKRRAQIRERMKEKY